MEKKRKYTKICLCFGG